LDLPRFGCLNVHTSLLPKYRGAAPIQWAILNGDAESGVTIMKMDVGMDTGAMVSQEKTPIHPEDNAQTLHDRLAQLGAELLVKTIPGYVSGKIQPQPQPVEGVSHAPKIKKQDGRIDWTQPACVVWNRVRGLVPWPGAFTLLPTRKSADEKELVETTSAPNLLKIWEAEVVESSGSPGEILQADKSGMVIGCGTGALRVLILQREGGRRLNAPEFLAGHPLQVGEKLG
jgi:methionyl-tRNA formyltransferase